MKNLKIKYKLLSLSITLILTLLVMGIISLMFMAKINSGTTVVSSNWLPSVIIAEELNTATSDFRIAENGHVIAQDTATMSEYETNLAKNKQLIADMFYEYQTNLITNEIDKQLIEDANSLWQTYLELHNNMINYSMQNNTDAAYELLRGQSLDVFKEVSEVFLELVEFNKAGADKANLDGNALYLDALTFMAIIILVVTIFSMIFAFYIIGIISKPINEIENAAHQILSGNLNTYLGYTASDELGNLANSMRALCQLIKNIINDMDNKLTNLAEGDFRNIGKMQSFYIGDFKNLYVNIDKIQQSLSKTFDNMETISSQLSLGSEQVSESAKSVAEGVVSQIESIKNLSSNMQEMTAKITQTTQNTMEVKTYNQKSQQALIQSNEQVKEMIEAMGDINAKSQEIQKIIQDIDDIAFQTNILSLNAAVEAARAGESGKGFAVVADEVRNLAKKSAQSAKDTATLILQTTEVVDVGNKIAENTSSSIKVVITNAQELSVLVDHIAEVAQDQSLNASYINTEIEQISNVVSSNSASAKESATTSEELSEQSIVLQNLLSKFQI
ncbi:hypothetical protein AN641_07530 [Candidatus Epulonipiscioides gigas]|nr:hypothetical protein AN641_07530 [Epulopiscium sp. SCG-C07WGA-EpuloA2]